jgi:protein tyrosine/serine phosphatase
MKYFHNKRYIKLGLAVPVFAAIGFIWHEATEAYHFIVVTPGVLYRSGWMQPHGMNERIRQYGIRTVVNLCLPTEEMSLKNNNYLKEQEICRKNEVKLVYLPMPGNTPPAQDEIDQWLSLLKDSSNLPVLVHCAQGVTRTGTMTAIYEMELLHKSNKEAMTQLLMFGHKLDVPKRKKLCDFLRDYKPSAQSQSQSEHKE